MTPDRQGPPSPSEALLVVDVFDDFRHEDGPALLRSFRVAQPRMVRALQEARAAGVPVVFANDTKGWWHGDRDLLLERAFRGPGGPLMRPLAPTGDDRFVVKPRYSAFDLTPLALMLDELGITRILLAGATTEMCVTQTAIAARERGLQVTLLLEACAHVDAEDARVAVAYLERVVGVWVEGSVTALESEG